MTALTPTNARVGTPMTPARLAEIKALLEKATAGPWCAESLGEKGDGANVIGVAFHPNDENCTKQLSGWLRPFDDEGNEIEYYRDAEIAVCEHRNSNSGYDAAFIAASRTIIPELIAALREARAGALEEALACIPGGQICDPQEIADAIRAIGRKK